MGQIIERIYSQNLDNNMKKPALDLFKAILEIEESLLEWKAGLPAEIQIISSTDEIPWRAKTQCYCDNILSLRFLNARALLHRAVFAHLLLVTPTSPMSSRLDKEAEMLRAFAPKSMEICLESAITTIKIISHGIIRGEDLPAWWFSIYYGKELLCRVRQY